MADLTFTFGSSYGAGSAPGYQHMRDTLLRKRPRAAYEEAVTTKAPSRIVDRRVGVSALKSVSTAGHLR